MFAYNPTVNNQAGAIMGAGGVNAANTQAAATQQVGQNIGAALMTIAQAYRDDQTLVAEGKAFQDSFKVMAPALGMTQQQLDEFLPTIKDPRKAALVGRNLMKNFGAMGQHTLWSGRPQQTAATYGTRAEFENWKNTTGENAPVVFQGGDDLPESIEPPLPTE